MKTTVIQGGARLDRDVTVRMRDGARLFVNVFRPADHTPAQVVMSVTPYGKGKLPDWIHMTLMRLTGVRFGRDLQYQGNTYLSQFPGCTLPAAKTVS
jgi:predicted acyl esterase